MSSRDHTRKLLIGLVEPVCASRDLELVDLEYTQGPQGWVIRVFIEPVDRDAPAIGFRECEEVSRELSALFDVEDPVAHPYSLEVSSPGIARPLRTADHFRRFAGETAKVSLREAQDGRRNFTGRIGAVDEGGGELSITVDGESFSLRLDNVSAARLVPDWDALMKSSATKSSKGSRKPGPKAREAKG